MKEWMKGRMQERKKEEGDWGGMHERKGVSMEGKQYGREGGRRKGEKENRNTRESVQQKE